MHKGHESTRVFSLEGVTSPLLAVLFTDSGGSPATLPSKISFMEENAYLCDRSSFGYRRVLRFSLGTFGLRSGVRAGGRYVDNEPLG